MLTGNPPLVHANPKIRQIVFFIPSGKHDQVLRMIGHLVVLDSVSRSEVAVLSVLKDGDRVLLADSTGQQDSGEDFAHRRFGS